MHDPVLPLNAESDVAGGVKTMLTALDQVIGNVRGVDLSALKERIRA